MDLTDSQIAQAVSRPGGPADASSLSHQMQTRDPSAIHEAEHYLLQATDDHLHGAANTLLFRVPVSASEKPTSRARICAHYVYIQASHQ